MTVPAGLYGRVGSLVPLDDALAQMLSKRLEFLGHAVESVRVVDLQMSGWPNAHRMTCESLVPMIGSWPVGTTMNGLCAWWRATGPDVLNDLPTAVWLAFEDNDVAAFGGDFSARGDGG